MGHVVCLVDREPRGWQIWVDNELQNIDRSVTHMDQAPQSVNKQ